jgi:hypothetical protein
MKHIMIIIAAALLAASCTKEEQPVASENTGILDLFTPGADAATPVKEMYASHSVWVRTSFASVQEITNGYLEIDALVRARGAVNLDPEVAPEVYAYTASLLSNVSPAFARAFFPLEIFYVKTYGASYWVYPLKRLGRGRLIISWPNTTAGTIPVTDPANHYYQDSVLTTGVWNLIGPAITARMENPIASFVDAGKAYDGGRAYDQIIAAYNADGDLAKRDAAIAALTAEGGYLSGGGSREFRVDFAEWVRLLATESRANIQALYLDDSPARAAKYAAVVDFARQYAWDIQAAGDAFRRGHDAYKASL